MIADSRLAGESAHPADSCVNIGWLTHIGTSGRGGRPTTVKHLCAFINGESIRAVSIRQKMVVRFSVVGVSQNGQDSSTYY